MSTLKIYELVPVGTELFQDNESFLFELVDREESLLRGGLVVSQVTYSIAYEYAPLQRNDATDLSTSQIAVSNTNEQRLFPLYYINDFTVI